MQHRIVQPFGGRMAIGLERDGGRGLEMIVTDVAFGGGVMRWCDAARQAKARVQ